MTTYKVQPDAAVQKYAARPWWQWLYLWWQPRKHIAVMLPSGLIATHPDNLDLVRGALEAHGHAYEVLPPRLRIASKPR